MIIQHQTSVAAFAHNDMIYIWIGQPLLNQVISIDGGAAGVDIIAQARALQRFVSTRVFGRVN